MADKADITPELLRQLLRYEPETGKLFWKERTLSCFRGNLTDSEVEGWNRRYAGKEALAHIGQRGYPTGSVWDSRFYAHRVIWAVVNGDWPEQVDHINGDRSDNRLSNLRSVTTAENSRNQKKRCDSFTRHNGVSWMKSKNKWRARIGAHVHLGLFESEAEAIAARKLAEVSLGFHVNHGAR